MKMNRMDDILPLVERPSRYLGSEVNSIHKDLRRVKLRIALAFPDLYEIGTSHFGLQILYHILNRRPDIAAERVFAPAMDMAALLKSSGIALQTLESAWPVRKFDIVGFSLLYELNYTNVLSMLELAGIPFYAADRGPEWPLVIAGGPSMANPEPVADFFDAVLVGDGEEAVLEMADQWIAWKADGTNDREALLKIWSAIEGVYIPSFFTPRWNASGIQTLTPDYPNYLGVRRAILPKLDTAAFPENPILPFGRPVHDRLRLEISRGCTRGCRFCQAGMTYRPVRERKIETLLALTERSLAATGYEDLSLLSLSTGDYACLEVLLQKLMGRCEENCTAVSLPSIRAGTLTPELMKLIRRVRKTGFTIAPEAGSQRLRNVINKNISEGDILRTVTNAFTLGWRVIKLYFMIGLPTETSADLQALVDLVKRLRADRLTREPKGGRKTINVSLATFIPKPHTPFQWSPQLDLAESKERIGWLKEQLQLPGVHVKWQNPEVSLIEGLWSRGDRCLSKLLVAAYRRGCRFDGWSDQFRFHLWQAACEDTKVKIDYFVTRTRSLDDPLPWDHIDNGVSKNYLKTEWDRALAAQPTPDCRGGACNDCGVCDFDRVEPAIFDACPVHTEPLAPPPTDAAAAQTLCLSYAKKGPAKYFGHLEMVNIFLRAIRRAGLPVVYSHGFHPLPKVSFDDPLPIGLESLKEFMYLRVHAPIEPDRVPGILNRQLPLGLQVLDCCLAPAKSQRPAVQSVTYQLTLKDAAFDRQKLLDFYRKPTFFYERANRKGRTIRFDLKKTVADLELLSASKLRLTVIAEPGKTIRPFEVISQIFAIDPDVLKRSQGIKIGVNL